MPELPEVETVKRSIQPLIVGEVIKEVEIYYPGIIKKRSPEEFQRLIKDKQVNSIRRRGKYLLFDLSEGYTLVIHLRMTGQLIVAADREPLAKHTHLVFYLSGEKQLRFVDVRKFGLLYLIPTGSWHEAGGFAQLGPEPLGEDFTLAVLFELTRGKKGTVKSFLLNQRRIAGIGNIYADEILFAAALQPQRRVETLKPQEIESLYSAIRTKLEEGIEYRGTSIRNYIDGRGEKGGFQERLQVYDRGNRPCPRCGTLLVKTVVGGRGTVYCSRCQH